MESSLSSQVDDITQCLICLEEFNSPRSLPCLHSFCFRCLQGYYGDEMPGATAQCPTCREEFIIPENGLGGFRVNFMLQKLIDAKRVSRAADPCEVCSSDEQFVCATVLCVDCDQKLCERCSLPHKKMRGGAHVVRPLDAVPIASSSQTAALVATSYKCLQSTCVGVEVRGVALLDGRLYVVRKNSSQIEVLNPATLAPLCTVPVPTMTSPGSMASCQTQRSLYVTCFSKKEVLKIAVAGAVPGRALRWPVVSGSPDGVSVSANCNVVVAVRDTGQLVIFTHAGQMVQSVKLPSSLASPRHAIQLDNDQFLLCHGWGSSAYGIHLVGADGRLIRSAGNVLDSPRKSFAPTSLAMDRRGNVLVAAFYGNTVQLYDRQLNYVADAVPRSCGLTQPFRLCYDRDSGRLYVGEYSGMGRVFVFSA